MTEAGIVALLRADPLRWQALGHVAALALPQGCIGAGFIRNLVWDHLHGRVSDCRDEDVDVLWHGPQDMDPATDQRLEARLTALNPDLRWSVRNQARMHLRNGDAPYDGVEAAMRHWPETATAIAACRDGGTCRLIAPFGLADLGQMILRPTLPARRAAFETRIGTRGWLGRWPRVRLAAGPGGA
ncbi:nucleotidyltransferase family protein [Gemmobacter nectariphilus]|uniref:nucleotidyltransferase family protein n=1 Tax=Gemmobacter nectariphilus TaxID=220343 RepID=UPI00041C4022|nr:nucleotidyltransferase family protein [Gemmobacter nectariphilus]